MMEERDGFILAALPMSFKSISFGVTLPLTNWMFAYDMVGIDYICLGAFNISNSSSTFLSVSTFAYEANARLSFFPKLLVNSSSISLRKSESGLRCAGFGFL